MKLLHHCYLMLGIVCSTGLVRSAAPLASGHVDLGIGYEAGAFDLHVHDEENGVEYAPNEALLVVNKQALWLSPGGSYSFLGPAGTPLWVLPMIQNPELLYLGVGAEELIPADWLGTIEFSLRSVSGPGNFYVWNTDALGTPIVKMDSATGITDADHLNVVPGSHEDSNWGFSAPGLYQITFAAAGINAADGPQNSGPVTFTFEVVPEPKAAVLLVLGLVAGGYLLRRRHNLRSYD